MDSQLDFSLSILVRTVKSGQCVRVFTSGHFNWNVEIAGSGKKKLLRLSTSADVLVKKNRNEMYNSVPKHIYYLCPFMAQLHIW